MVHAGETYSNSWSVDLYKHVPMALRLGLQNLHYFARFIHCASRHIAVGLFRRRFSAYLSSDLFSRLASLRVSTISSLCLCVRLNSL